MAFRHETPLTYVVSALLLLMAVLMPVHVLPWVSWANEWPLFLCVGWAAMVLSTRRNDSPIPVPQAVLAGLAVLVCGQAVCGVIPFAGDAVVLVLYLWGLAVAIQLGYSARHLQKLVHVLALAVCTLAVISVLIAIVQALGLGGSYEWINPMSQHRRPGANLGQPNHLGTWIVWGLASLGYLWQSTQNQEAPRRWQWPATLVFALLLFGVALTESRTGLLTASLVNGGWLVAHWSRQSAWQRVRALTPLIVLWSMAWYIPRFLNLYWQEDGGSMGAGLNLQAGTRLEIWPQLLQAVWMQPWRGWGLRNVSEAHNAVLDQFGQSEPFTYAHNIVLDLAIGMGIPLTVCLLVLVGVWLYRRVLAARSAQHWYCLAMLLALAVHSMLEYPFSYAYFLFPAGLLIGILERELSLTSHWRLPRLIRLLVSAVAVIGMVAVAVEYLQVEEDFRVARFEALRVGSTPDDYVRPKVHLLTQLDAMLIATRTVPQPNMSKAEIDLLRKAAMRFPWTAIQGRYALSLALNGNIPEAQRQLKVIRTLYGDKMVQSFRVQWQEKAIQYPQLQGATEF